VKRVACVMTNSSRRHEILVGLWRSASRLVVGSWGTLMTEAWKPAGLGYQGSLFPGYLGTGQRHRLQSERRLPHPGLEPLIAHGAPASNLESRRWLSWSSLGRVPLLGRPREGMPCRPCGRSLRYLQTTKSVVGRTTRRRTRLGRVLTRQPRSREGDRVFRRGMRFGLRHP
jgi:hypothetical protein